MSILAGEPFLNRRYHPVAVPIIRASRQHSAFRTLNSMFSPTVRFALASLGSSMYRTEHDLPLRLLRPHWTAILSVLRVGLTSSAIDDSCEFLLCSKERSNSLLEPNTRRSRGRSSAKKGRDARPQAVSG